MPHHTKPEGEQPHMAHTDIDPADPTGRRIGAVVLVRNRSGDVLLVRPAYKNGWQLPGGGARPGEALVVAAARELKEETGLSREIRHALALDQVPVAADSPSAEGFDVVCDGGTLTPEEASAVTVPESAPHALSSLTWVPLDDLDTHTFPCQERRIRAAVAAAEHGLRLPLLLLGE